MRNALYSVTAIALCLLLGKFIASNIGGLPGSLYGMILFTALLHYHILNANKFQASIAWIIKHMGVCFVPAGVGIINHFDLIQQHGLSIVVIIFISTFFLITLIGLFCERILMSQSEKPQIL